MTRSEEEFELEFRDDLLEMFPGGEYLKGASVYRQGIPDRIFIFQDFYAFFEIKKRKSSAKRVNQEFYIEKFDRWSFAAFVYPENKDEVLDAVQQAFESRRTARSS